MLPYLEFSNIPRYFYFAHTKYTHDEALSQVKKDNNYKYLVIS